jgi:hypothetical protein
VNILRLHFVVLEAVLSNFFTDVISNDPRFNSVSRVDDLGLVEPTTRELIQRVVAGAKNLGIDVMVFETYRSQARQEELFRQGATQLQKVGVHHYGLACDIVKVVNGEPSWKGDFSFLGHLAHSAGLIWGGDWGNPDVTHTFIDEVHLQRCTVARQPDLFAGTWYPAKKYNPYQDEQYVMFAAVVKQKPSKT